MTDGRVRDVDGVPWPTVAQVRAWLDAGDAVVLLVGLDVVDSSSGLARSSGPARSSRPGAVAGRAVAGLVVSDGLASDGLASDGLASDRRVVPDAFVVPDRLVPLDERARAGRMATGTLRRRALHGFALRRLLLGELLDTEPAAVTFRVAPCSACGEPHGRPELDHPTLHANVSHSDGLLALALRHGAALGVDVEVLATMGAVPPPRAWLTAAEQAFVAPDDVRRLAQAWVTKEAVLKATGEGLNRPLLTAPVLDPDALQAWAPGMVHAGLDAAGEPWVGALAGVDLGRVRVAEHPIVRAAAVPDQDAPG